MSVQDLINKVSQLVDSTVRDFTTLEDWITEGDTDGMTPEEIAQEWNELPEMETGN